MLYLLAKATISGVLIMAASEIAKRSPKLWSVARFPSTRLNPRHDMALARDGRQREDCLTLRSDVLVSVAHSPNVSGFAHPPAVS